MKAVLSIFSNSRMPFCSQCTIVGKRIVEFSTLRELSAHIKAGHPLPEHVKVQENEEKRTEKEIKEITRNSTKHEEDKPRKEKRGKQLVTQQRVPMLSYRYVGEHCEREIETIQISLPSFDTVVAYCTVCRNQLTSRNVIPIDKQRVNK